MPELSSESRIEHGFFHAAALPSAERGGFLDSYCGNDSDLRSEIDAMLSHHATGTLTWLDRPLLSAPRVQEALAGKSALAGVRVGPYELEEELGRGGMAAVYRGRRVDGLFEKKVAIKILNRLQTLGPEEERFQQERKILGRLDTPFIVKILDAGVDEGNAYFVMDHIDGAHIDEHCRRRNLSVEERLRLFLHVCRGVSAAHNSNVVHRDLKPANILVDPAGNPHLIDFGIAKAIDPIEGGLHTEPGLTPMTMLYASPEQLRGDAELAGLPSTDVYSLGAVLYEVLTGRRPLTPPAGMQFAEIQRFLIETEPLRPSHFDVSLRGDLDYIVLKALEKDRLRRYQSVEQFASFVELYLANRPLPERPPGWRGRAWRFLKRNRTETLIAALFLFTIIAGVVATLREARISERRFQDVRRLATSFLFEFDAAIASLKGGTEARALVVAKATEYLDKLSAESAGDQSLQEELANAYERLGGIQGSVMLSNLGNTGKSIDSYRKALTMRQRIAAAGPRDWRARLALSNSQSLMADGLFKSDPMEAIRYYNSSIVLLEGLQAGAHDARTVGAALAKGRSRLCNLLLAVSDHAGAINHCHQAVAAAEVLAAEDPGSVPFRSVLAVAYGQTGNALLKDGRTSDAIPFVRRAVAEFEKLSALQPNNNNYARNLAGSFAFLANTLASSNDVAGATSSMQRSVSINRQLVLADAADANAKTALANSLCRVATLQWSAGRKREALTAGAEGLAIFKALADRPGAGSDDLNDYASYLQETSVPALRDPATALGYAKRAVAASKAPTLVLLSTLANTYFDAGFVDAAISTAERALSANPIPNGQPPSRTGVRADLVRSFEKFKAASQSKTGH